MCAHKCHEPSVIEKEVINAQTSLAVVINVHLPVFLMGHLIKKLFVAAGLLSHPITAPPCQNLCHWPSHPIPHCKHVPRVSYDICVSRSCDGMLLACYSSAGAPCWLPSSLQPCSCCGWVTCHRRSRRSRGGTSGVKVQGTMVKESEGIDAAAFHHSPLCTLQAGWRSSPLGAYPSLRAHPPLPPPCQTEDGRVCI